VRVLIAALLGGLLLISEFLSVPLALAQEMGKETGRAIPRYVSIRADEANLRVGPGGQYPIKWRLLRSGMPAQIVDEQGQWREVMLHDGERGWLHAPLLSGARTLYVTVNRAPITSSPDSKASLVAYAERRVILRVEQCEPHWCEVRKGKLRGWVLRRLVWGILPTEILD
jgi:SH3-like domain-containing protein